MSSKAPTIMNTPSHGTRIAGNYHFECYCGFNTKSKGEFNTHLANSPQVSIQMETRFVGR